MKNTTTFNMENNGQITLHQFLIEKINNFVKYLLMNFNHDAKFTPLLQQIIAFTNTPVNDFVIYIATQLKLNTPEVWLHTFVTHSLLQKEDFSAEQYSKIIRYLHYFVDIISQ